MEGAEGTCSSPITRVVRKDGSGTTYQFKNYLFKLFNKGLFCTTGGTEGKATWQDLEPIGSGGKPNIDWPESCPEKTLSPVVRSASTGGGALVNQVDATDGSIGYASLPDAVANKDAGTILALQNNGQKKAAKPTSLNRTWAHRQLHRRSPTRAENWHDPLDIDWSQVFGAQPAVGGESYPLCTLTYGLVWNDYSAAGFTAAESITIRDFVYEYVVPVGRPVGDQQQLLRGSADLGQPAHRHPRCGPEGC